MGVLATNDCSKNSKPAKYVRPNKVHNNSSIISSSGFRFHPFLKHNQQQARCKWNQKRQGKGPWNLYPRHQTPHKIAWVVEASVVSKKWLLLLVGIPHTCYKSSTHLRRWWANKIRNLAPCSCPLCAKVTTKCRWMTKFEDRVNLMVQNASPSNLITTHFPQIGVIPNVIPSIAL